MCMGLILEAQIRQLKKTKRNTNDNWSDQAVVDAIAPVDAWEKVLTASINRGALVRKLHCHLDGKIKVRKRGVLTMKKGYPWKLGVLVQKEESRSCSIGDGLYKRAMPGECEKFV